MWLYQITLISLTVLGVHPDSHTLRYYYTAVSDRGSGLPEFSIVGYVDDREFIQYNSESRRARPVTRWMEENEGSEYWDLESDVIKGDEPLFRHNVRTAMSRFNQTGGLHSFQVMYGCELRDDGSTAGYNQYGYDGRDFMHLDTQSGLYYPTMHEAQITAQRVNSPEERVGERDKNYLENICVPWLRKYVGYGREDLERRVRPEVTVRGRQSDEVTRLQCLVYGFHPRTVVVNWVKNGEIYVLSDEASPILPHPDGTYQIRVSVEVPTTEGDTYACHVEHSSLEETLSVIWEPNKDTPILVIVGAVLGCLVAIPLIAGVIKFVMVLMKRKGGYKTTSNAESHSDSSNPHA